MEVIKFVTEMFAQQAQARRIQFIEQNLGSINQEHNTIVHKSTKKEELFEVEIDSIYTERQSSRRGDLPCVLGDMRRLQQVLINLVKNALKFTHDGSISISACYLIPTQSLRISVKDSGLGLKKNQVKKLFREYGRLSGNEEVNNEGIGLGLQICKNLVE